MNNDIDVLVVGAGPVGLTIAIALRRLGLTVRIVDKDPGTDREPRADVLFPRAGEALGSLGVGETLQRNAYQMQGADIYDRGRHLGAFQVGRLESRYPRAMTIEQHDIERLLAEHLAEHGATVEWRTRATDMRVYSDRVEMSLRLPTGDTERLSAAWVVGCDGIRSTIRERLGIPFEGKNRANMQVVQGNVTPSWPHSDEPGQGYFFLAPHRSVIAFPTPAGGYRIFCVRDDVDPGRTDAPTLDELRDVVAEAACLPDLQLKLTEPVWLSRARFADRVAARLRSGRVLLAGDAAHSWAPIGGHGMNVGILGAHNLAWKIAAVHRGQADDAVLDSYSAEQRALAFRVIRDMRFNIMEALLPPLGHRVRSAVLRVALTSAGFQRRGEWMMSDFGRNHRKGPLSWQRTRGFVPGLRAGDRVPDVTVVPAAPPAVADGAVRLHDLLGYDRWTLLLSSARADAATVQALRDACAPCPAPVVVLPVTAAPAAARQLGRADEIALVRPDGYVGLVAPLGRVDLLRDYLSTFLLAPDLR
ncbi:FAD-dependent monooxygenase [Pseudonocardia acidicola]|uniref:FAD-dependent oxidoreductase n=1 Tax=Pseudonocardia acidicola TaxID=2724939 RepID=A0ABX1SI86_9PSEU|nr:FAD-dependent oxidoreductase [Pseudonocardia acidicola]